MYARFAALLLILSTAASSHAADSKVTFLDSYTYPANTQVSIAYFTAKATADDAITGLKSDCCKAVELHRNEKINGAMAMRRIARLTLDKGKAASVVPNAKNGEHVMLIGLKRTLAEGDTLPITFTFENAPEQTVNFQVVHRPGSAPAPAASGSADTDEDVDHGYPHE